MELTEKAAGYAQVLNKRQLEVIRYLQAHQSLTRKEYCELTGVSPRTAHRDLADLVGRGLLESVGKGRSSRYILTGG